MERRLPAGVLLSCLAAATAAAAAEPLAADIRCDPAGAGPVYAGPVYAGPVYDCVIALADPGTGAPVSGAQFTVRTDMPSMPMAHAMRPVAALPADRPGAYRVRLALEMYGTWTVKLRLSKPVHDQIDRRMDFFESR